MMDVVITSAVEITNVDVLGYIQDVIVKIITHAAQTRVDLGVHVILQKVPLLACVNHGTKETFVKLTHAQVVIWTMVIVMTVNVIVIQGLLELEFQGNVMKS